MTDPISDMLTRIRNAQSVSHQAVSVPYSKLKLNLAKILEKEDFIGEILTKGRRIGRTIEIKLKYDKGEPAIRSLKRVSRPGQRIYKNKDGIRLVKDGYGLAIISTSQGLMTNKEARKNGLGGEIICEVW